MPTSVIYTPIATQPVPNTVWASLPLANGWANAGGTDATAQYRLTPGGRVVCKGLIQQTALLVVGALIATLPTGFRPLERRSLSVGINAAQLSAINVQRFYLLPNGQLTYQGTALNLALIQISLEQIEFDAEQ